MFITLISTPVLLMDRHLPTLYVMQLRTLFSTSALVTLGFGLFSRHPASPASLGVWDHVLTFLFLKLGC